MAKLNDILAQIDRLHGKGSIYRYGDGIKGAEVKGVISTGSKKLDLATGVDGIPRGRIVEIYGPESSGKTTLALHIVAEEQKNQGVVAFIDAEHALDMSYAKNIGVDIDSLLISQPDNGEQALEIVEKLLAVDSIGLIVVDSVAALVPRAEIEGEMGDSHMGLHARLMSQAMRKLSGKVSKSNCCLVFINQIREKIGVVFGNPEVTTGGRALKFYATMRLEIRYIGRVKDGDEIVSNKTKVTVVKNKVAAPFKKVEFEIRYGEGIDRLSEMIDIGLEYEMIGKSGTWYSFGDKRIGQGREVVRKALRDEEDLRNSLSRLLFGEDY
jgi:recombination protein RecA